MLTAIVPHRDCAVTGFPGQFANALQLAGAQHFYNRHRDYDPTTGRYIQADPIGLNGDPNPYAYARGNALRYMDPSGEFAPLVAAAAVAGSALIGAGSDLAFQAALNWADGNDVLDPNCYDWGSVAFTGGASALTGGLGAWAGKELRALPTFLELKW